MTLAKRQACIQPISCSTVYYVANRMFRPSDVYASSLFDRPRQALDAQVAVRFLKQKVEVKGNISNLLNSASLVYQNYYDQASGVSTGEAPTRKELLYKSGTG